MNGNSESWIIFLVIGVAAVIISTAITMATRKRKISSAILGDAAKRGNRLTAWKTISGQVDGVTYEYYYHRGGKNSPPYLEVRVESQRRGSFKVTRQTGFDRLFKRWGIASEISTPDPQFDDFFYITSDNEEFAGQFFANKQNRRAVSEIYDMSFKTISLEKHIFKARWSHFRPKSDFDPGTIEAIARKLIEMRSNTPETAEPQMETAPAWKKKRISAFAIPILLGVTGAAALVYGLVNYRPLDGFKLALHTLKFSLPLSIVFIWFAVSLLRGRSSSHRELLAVFLISLFVFPLAGAGFGIFLNGWLDRSKPVEHKTLLLNKYISRSSKNTDYYMVVQSWRPGIEKEKFGISRSSFYAIVPFETRVKVVTRSGKFNFEWLVNYDFYMPGFDE
jgi:hypothetical protein